MVAEYYWDRRIRHSPWWPARQAPTVATRFASPNGLAAFTATRSPYLDAPQFDPVTGKTEGLLSRLTPETTPRIMYTNSSTEYWGGGRSAALTHTTLDGKEDATVPENVRIYRFSGTQHSPSLGGTASRTTARDSNPNDYAWGQRALLAALDRWVREGTAPPASYHPNLADGTLVAQKSLAFPAIPGVRSPLGIPGGFRSDLEGGPSAHPRPFLVPKVDADGNELGGIRFPEIAVPLATYSGWNFRNPSRVSRRDLSADRDVCAFCRDEVRTREGRRSSAFH
jgi:hypothetical protein